MAQICTNFRANLRRFVRRVVQCTYGNVVVRRVPVSPGGFDPHRMRAMPAGTVGTDASASGVGGFAYTDIATMILGARNYVVAALFEVGHTDRVVFGAGGIFSNDAGASFTESWFINSGSLDLPMGGAGSGSDDQYFGPGIRIAAVPEPGTLA